VAEKDDSGKKVEEDEEKYREFTAEIFDKKGLTFRHIKTRKSSTEEEKG
jgi:hypothetical protein